MRITDTSDLWWKTAVVYCLDVETFLDWNDDGIGDFEGLAHRMDYLHELGITCLWLMPFYPTPNKDDGYDIADFYGIDPRLGDHGDFVEMIRMAKDRGIRVIIDLVVNHTSDQHPWFVEARKSRDNPHRDFYVWRDHKPRKKVVNVFPDVEDGVWTLDEKTGQYYLHHFYRFQPDLNVTNPRVRDEVAKIMGFWLELGVSGFRVDAVPFLMDESRGREARGRAAASARLPEVAACVPRPPVGRRDDARRGQPAPRPIRSTTSAARTATASPCSSTSSRCRTSTCRSRERIRQPLVAALESRPEIAVESQWANFVRNHDELTLDKLTDAERQEVFAAFGPEPEMQVYDRGIIRRLPPMLGGDPRRIRMAYSLMFSLPGTPVLFYGEELGMGEDLAVGSRLAVRTPMQWTTRPQRRVLRGAEAQARAQGRRRRVLARARQRVRPAARLRLPAALHAHPRRALSFLARDGLGPVRAARAARRDDSRAQPGRAPRDAWSRSTTSAMRARSPSSRYPARPAIITWSI